MNPQHELDELLDLYTNLTPAQRLEVHLETTWKLLLRGDLRGAWMLFATMAWPTVRVFVLGFAGAVIAAGGLLATAAPVVLAGFAVIAAAWLLARDNRVR